MVLINPRRCKRATLVNTNGTLASLLQVKLANRDTCIVGEPPKELLKCAKGQHNTMIYARRKPLVSCI